MTMRRSHRRPALFLAFTLSLGAALPAAADGWKKAGEKKGIVIYNKKRAGSDVAEVKAIGTINAPPWAAKNVVDDLARYKEFMPYTEESTAVKKGNHVISYQRLNTPFVAKRDYTLRIVDRSVRQADGTITYKSVWSEANAQGPAEIKGVVRVKVNEGYWLFEPADGGKKTKVTYYLFTDPGGALPAFIVNAANTRAIPDLFKAVEENAKNPRYTRTQPKLPATAAEPKPAALEAAPAK
jgi:hypothetical protein